jgi:hypothetical protein
MKGAAVSPTAPQLFVELDRITMDLSCRRRPASSNALIRLMRVFWTPAFAGVTSYFSTDR